MAFRKQVVVPPKTVCTPNDKTIGWELINEAGEFVCYHGDVAVSEENTNGNLTWKCARVPSERCLFQMGDNLSGPIQHVYKTTGGRYLPLRVCCGSRLCIKTVSDNKGAMPRTFVSCQYSCPHCMEPLDKCLRKPEAVKGLTKLERKAILDACRNGDNAMKDSLEKLEKGEELVAEKPAAGAKKAKKTVVVEEDKAAGKGVKEMTKKKTATTKKATAAKPAAKKAAPKRKLVVVEPEEEEEESEEEATANGVTGKDFIDDEAEEMEEDDEEEEDE